jgi:hypothetical protein
MSIGRINHARTVETLRSINLPKNKDRPQYPIEEQCYSRGKKLHLKNKKYHILPSHEKGERTLPKTPASEEHLRK